MATLHDLINEKLPGQRFGIFFSTGEGRFYPDGSEESSGFVVAEDGSHWFWWTAWQDGRLAFSIWESEQYQEEWGECAEYSAAQAEAREARSSCRLGALAYHVWVGDPSDGAPCDCGRVWFDRAPGGGWVRREKTTKP